MKRLLPFLLLLVACDQQASIGERSDAGHALDVGMTSDLDADVSRMDAGLDANGSVDVLDGHVLVPDTGAGADADAGAGTDAEADAGTDADADVSANADADVGADGSQPDAAMNEPDSGPPTRTCGVNRGACDVVAQDCSDPTHGCYFASEEVGAPPSTMCREPNMAGEDGAPCTFVNDCSPGLTCASDGRCRRYCCAGSSTDCPVGSGQRCIGIAGAEEMGMCMAPATCDLRTSEGCDGGQACYMLGFDGSVTCFTAGTQTEGMSCSTLNGCAPGMGCFTSGPSDLCHRFCRISLMDADCGGLGRTCAFVAGVSLPSGLGICL